MIQDIFPYSFDVSYTQKALTAQSVIICFKAGQVLVSNQPESEPDIELHFPSCSELGLLSPQTDARQTRQHPDQQAIYLFAIDNADFFLVKPEHIAVPDGFSFVNTSLFRSAQPQHLAFAGITAEHLHKWYEANQICGCCANRLQHDSAERMMFCPQCQNTVYPKIAPAVIVGIFHGDELLLTRYAGRSGSRYALVAGYTEIGETAEDTVRREVKEEVGLDVKNLRYFKSQPWGLSGSLLLGFYAELDGADEVTLDTNELSEAVWVHRSDIDVTMENFSLTNEMIYRFKQGF